MPLLVSIVNEFAEQMARQRRTRFYRWYTAVNFFFQGWRSRTTGQTTYGRKRDTRGRILIEMRLR